ncbi:general secretion pathway protein GspB [Oceanisphaera sp. KMM 10153]|uniref:general secretion pathway protein GspB n=1 Tax=Oceanisphaera submarina TaxID=3390193 RepID=UPI003974D9FB
MSYILDALKQSERKRSRQASSAETAPPPGEIPSLQRTPGYRHRLWWLPAGVLLALILGYGLGKIGSAWLQSPQQVITLPVPGATLPEDAAAAEPDPATTRTPIVIDSSPMRILLDEPPTLTMNPDPRASTTAAPIIVVAGPKPLTASDSVSVPEPAFDPGVPDLRELPASIRTKLPALTLSVHIYSKTAGSRMASINGQMLREGQQIGALRLQSITPKGVILNFEGQAFHLKSVGG